MANDQELLIRINGTAKNFTEELDKVRKKTEDLEKALIKTAKVSAAGFTALIGVIAATTARFAKFEKGFTNVVTLLDKSSFTTKTLAKGIDDLKGEVISLGAESGESFETLNQGLFDLVSSGVAAESSIDALTAATELAIAGATTTDVAVKALAATFTSFGKEAGTAREISEKFFTAQKFGVTTVAELASEFNKVAGISKELGLSFDETLASLSSLTANGAKPTTVAASELRAALNAIILVQGKLKNESAAVQDALSLQNIRQRGLIASLDLLKEATGGNVVEIQRLLGSSEALGTVLSLTGAQSDLVKKQIKELGDEEKRAATFTEALNVKNATSERAFKRLGTSVDAAATVLGEQFAPVVNTSANALAEIVKVFVGLNPLFIKAIAVVIGLSAALFGTVTIVALATLGYIKFKALLIATNAATKIAAISQGALNFVVGVGDKILKLFRITTLASATAVRVLAGATGIGLLVVALGFLLLNYKKIVPATIATFKAAGTFIKAFVQKAGEQLSALGSILVGVFTFDIAKIKSGLDTLKDNLINGLVDIGKKTAGAFNVAFAEALQADAPEIGEAKKDEEDESKKDEKAEQDLQRIRDEGETKRELLIEEREKDAALIASFDQLTVDNQVALSKKDLDNAKKTIKTKRKIRNDFAKEQLATRIKENNTFLAEQERFGTTFATINRVVNSEEVKNADKASKLLVGLQRSKNSQLKAIGKSSALVQIGISTARGAVDAFTSFAKFGPIGAALGAAAAAAIVLFGAEQAGSVIKAQGGGIVPNAIGGQRDRVNILAEPGELIVPAALTPSFLQTAGRPDPGEDVGAEEIDLTINLKGDAVEMFEIDVVRRQAQGISKLPDLGLRSS